MKNALPEPGRLAQGQVGFIARGLHAMPEAQLNGAERESRVMWRSEATGGVLLQYFEVR